MTALSPNMIGSQYASEGRSTQGATRTIFDNNRRTRAMDDKAMDNHVAERGTTIDNQRLVTNHGFQVM
ncbi:MAG TPA: hypothetical protein VJ870_20985 [Amycolatopsis sp.]|nr:hypothetical protein [Amycolatopsis sp.]